MSLIDSLTHKILCLLVVAGAAACEGSAEAGKPQTASAVTSVKAPPEASRSPAPPGAKRSAFALPAADRVVAIGDVHGDLDATRRALKLAGAIDEGDRWIGGKLVVVQTGDQLDRGDQEREILELLEALEGQAAQAGGALHVLLGNHETMNVSGDFRYVTARGFAAFADVRFGLPEPVKRRVAPEMVGRVSAFFPGGPYAVKLSKHRVVVAIGDTVFAHGGVLPEHVRFGIDRLNAETSAWMRGEAAAPPRPVLESDGPVWTRRYSDHAAEPDCATLKATLDALGMRRMVVGHTPQPKGITSACDDRVWRIDVGMSAFYGGRVEVLEIRRGALEVLREK